MLSECTYYKKNLSDPAQNIIALFFRVLFVFPDQFVRIKEHFCCGFEMNAVLLKVYTILFLVPFKRSMNQININTII